MGLKVSNKDLHTLQQIEAELQALYEYCKQSNLTEEDMEEICEPLTSTINKTAFLKKIRIYGTIFTVILILYALYQFEFFSWHITALGRILMIELLPIFNWKTLKNEKCLLENTFNKENVKYYQECTFCEAINNIPIENQPSGDFINQQYISLNMPVVIANSTSVDTIKMTDFVNDIGDDFYGLSYPCKLSSNILSNEETALEILKKSLDFQEYFLHFQNCNFDAVKHFRRFFKKPEYLKQLSPVQYSWVLASKFYNVFNSKFKPVYLSDKVALVLQLFGENFFRLKPYDCGNDCPDLEVHLKAGEAMIVTSVWNIEYLPNAETENFAVILEMH